jgi:hypothetical protein
MIQHKNVRTELSRHEWMLAAGGLLLATRLPAQSSLLPLNTSGLDHLSITVPDTVAAATFYEKDFRSAVVS